MVDKRCHHCKETFKDEAAIPHRDIKKRTEEYNHLKIKYIAGLQ
jgi:hypothetical protein